MPAFIDVTGQRFGRLVAMKIEPSNQIGTRWRCKCDCGSEAVTYIGRLRNGETQSCGCYQRECISARKRIHGQSHGISGKAGRLYVIWMRMRSRCHDEGSADYPRYGGRGINICPEWATFLGFEKWALANGYRGNLTIDRFPDNDGNYEPSNCRWATPVEQARNRPGYNVIYTYKGKEACLTEHMEDAGVSLKYATVRKRVTELGWSVEKALNYPIRRAAR